MKIGVIKTIVREELSKFEALPRYMDALLQTLNQFITQVGQAIKGNLTFQDNFLCAYKSITLTHGVAQEVNPNTSNKSLKVVGVLLTSAGGLIMDSFGWSTLSNGNISVTIYYKTGTSANCTLVVLLG